MHMYGREDWALNRSEGDETKKAGMRFLRHVSGYELNPAIRNALHMYASEEWT
jgi:hypothetical protein